jgi:hypothetical protein
LTIDTFGVRWESLFGDRQGAIADFGGNRNEGNHAQDNLSLFGLLVLLTLPVRVRGADKFTPRLAIKEED